MMTKRRLAATGFWAALLAFALLLVGSGVPALAEARVESSGRAAKDTLIVSAQQDYDYAREVFDAVNEERAKAGLPAVALDEELTEDAMQRAAELSLLYDHTRPDGTSWKTASDKAVGENIAAGSSAPSAVMGQWMNSPDHKDNILDTSWGSMGVGCVRVGSVTYWVQLFSGVRASGSVPRGTRTQMVTISVSNSKVPFADGSSGFNLGTSQESLEPLAVGETYGLVVEVKNPGWRLYRCPADASSFTWKSSNSAVATVGADGVVRAVGAGTATVSATSRAGYTWTKTFAVTAAGSGGGQQQAGTQQMYRLYNRYTGEHFYTASATERDSLVKVGWTSEGVGWVAPTKSNTPVYRLYNSYVKGGDHHYTTSASEKDALVKAGWTYEGVGWYSDDAKGTPLYRQYNPYATTGTHNYTADKHENDELVKKGWRAEGIGWYGVKS